MRRPPPPSPTPSVQPDAARLQAETNELLATIGQRIRALRTERDLTLHALAERTGLSSSMLSLLERGKTGPSIGTLVVIASALGTEMSALIDRAPEEEGPVSRRATQPLFVTAEGVRRRILRADAQHGVEIAVNDYRPGTASAERQVSHDGHEFGVVLNGTLEVTLNDRIHILAEGDLISYRSTDPHRIANPSGQPARALWINLRRG